MTDEILKDPRLTFLEIIQHILKSHPSLHENVAEICNEISQKEDQFKLIIARWFNDKGDKTLRLEYPLNSQSIVFDLGGYEGDFCYEINKKFNCFVYVFEPSKKYFEKCIKRFKDNTKIKCFNFGFSSENGEYFLSDEANGSSIIRNYDSTNGEKIIIKDICVAFHEFGINNIDLMKINVEGP